MTKMAKTTKREMEYKNNALTSNGIAIDIEEHIRVSAKTYNNLMKNEDEAEAFKSEMSYIDDDGHHIAVFYYEHSIDSWETECTEEEANRVFDIKVANDLADLG